MPMAPPHLMKMLVLFTRLSIESHVLSCVHVTLSPSLGVFNIGAAVALHTTDRTAKQTYCCINWHGLAPPTHERLVLFAEEVVEHQRESCKAIHRGHVQKNMIGQRRRGVGVSVMSAPTGERVLQCVLIREVRQRGDSEHDEKPVVFTRFWGSKGRCREGGGKDSSTEDCSSSEERKRECVQQLLDTGFPKSFEGQSRGMLEERRVSDDGHEKHSYVAKDVFMGATRKLRCVVAPNLVQNEDEAYDSTCQARVVC